MGDARHRAVLGPVVERGAPGRRRPDHPVVGAAEDQRRHAREGRRERQHRPMRLGQRRRALGRHLGGVVLGALQRQALREQPVPGERHRGLAAGQQRARQRLDPEARIRHGDARADHAEALWRQRRHHHEAAQRHPAQQPLGQQPAEGMPDEHRRLAPLRQRQAHVGEVVGQGGVAQLPPALAAAVAAQAHRGGAAAAPGEVGQKDLLEHPGAAEGPVDEEQGGPAGLARRLGLDPFEGRTVAALDQAVRDPGPGLGDDGEAASIPRLCLVHARAFFDDAMGGPPPGAAIKSRVT